MKKILNKIRSVVSIPAMILLVLFAAALIVEALAKGNPALADGVSDTTGVVIRGALAYVTCFFGFSLAEYLLIASPLLLALLVIFIVRRVKRSVRLGIRSCVTLLSLVSLIYTVFVFGYGTGYYGRGVASKMDLERHDLSPEELYQTALLLVEQMEKDVPKVMYPEGTYSAMPYSYTEMNGELLKAYDKLTENYPSFQRLYVPTKPVMLSEPWTYTHTSGMYCLFTGEANVNTNYPDYIVVSSAAHEMAHQRGVTKEDECNFLSFVVCSMSDDPYVRYSGYADVLNTVLGSLSSADRALYDDVRARMPKEIAKEYQAYSIFFTKYRENTAAKVSNAVNNAYLEQHNQPAGIKSYGLFVDLVAAYMLQNNK